MQTDRTVQFLPPTPQQGEHAEIPIDTVIPKRWKHASWPGSIKATRIDYGADQSAFVSAKLLTPEKQARKAEVIDFKCPNRLGHRPLWNTSVEPIYRFPDRPVMHAISEFQSLKPVHNFRAERLPDLFHSTVFHPKANKFQFDHTALRNNASGTKTMITTNVTLNSRAEFGVNNDSEALGWNASTQFDKASRSVDRFKDSGLVATKRRNQELLENKYCTPTERVNQFNMKIKAERLQRETVLPDVDAFPPEPMTLTKMRQLKLMEEAAAAHQATSAETTSSPV